MGTIRRFDTITEYNVFNDHETFHPLVTVVLKDVKCGDLYYGKHTYDYQEGTLVFFAPGQVAGVDDAGELYYPKGHAPAFHSDLIRGTGLGQHIQDYSFFSYNVSEALHISERERQVVLDCFAKIDSEMRQSIDKHSKKLIVSNIELFLNYCTRFYDRQFITRDNVHRGILDRFEQLLQDYIQEKVIDVAKEKIFDTTKSVSEIAYTLGFKYPQHFSRLFKQRVGYTPNEYGSLN